jgi:hypothetical protein
LILECSFVLLRSFSRALSCQAFLTPEMIIRIAAKNRTNEIFSGVQPYPI